MPNELIRPIDPESARAIEEAAKTLGKAIDAAVKAGGYVGNVLGDLPHDLVGMFGDWVKQIRFRRWIELSAETDKILRQRNVENRIDASPSIVIPLIDAAINEDRDELKELWAKLLAATLDPERAGFFRLAFVAAAQKMDPLDARVLQSVPRHGGGTITEETRRSIAAELQISRDELEISVINLVKLEFLVSTHPPSAGISAFGREFLRTVE